MTRVLVVEDNSDLAFGLVTALETGGYEVELVSDGAAGLERARLTPRPDLLILDLMLPRMTGFRVLRTLREEGNQVPVIILTARAEEADKVQGFRLGADQYVTKPFGVIELLARVDALLERRAARQDAPLTNGSVHDGGCAVYHFGEVEVATASREVRRGGNVVAVAPLEFDLLVALLRRNGAAATRKDLLREVWGYEADVTTRTLDTHVANLRGKLEANPAAPRYILTVRKTGYRLQQ